MKTYKISILRGIYISLTWLAVELQPGPDQHKIRVTKLDFRVSYKLRVTKLDLSVSYKLRTTELDLSVSYKLAVLNSLSRNSFTRNKCVPYTGFCLFFCLEISKFAEFLSLFLKGDIYVINFV